jgi:hypothetical protein
MMLRLVLASLAAILAGSAAHAQVGMRSPRSAITPGGSSAIGISGSACPSGGGAAGTTSSGSNFALGGSAMFGGQSAFGMNQSSAYSMPSIAVANNGYGGYGGYGYNAALMGAGSGYPTNLAATNGLHGGHDTAIGGYDPSQWGNSFGDNSSDGVMVAASPAKASTDSALRPRAKVKKSQSKIKSRTAKTRSS